MKRRIIQLHEGETKRIRFLSDRVKLASGAERTVVTITRTGEFYDPRYGRFSITRDMLLSMVKNFESNVYGQRIFLDVSHRPDLGAAATIERVFLDGNKLRAEVCFTPYGVEAVTQRGMVYLSAEYVEDFVDNERGEKHGATLLGAALTPRPVIKHLDPVDEDEVRRTYLTAFPAMDRNPVLVSERVVRTLSEETAAMKKFLDQLRKHLSETLKLPTEVVQSICAAFEAATANVTDETVGKTLAEAFQATGAAIADKIKAGAPTGEIKLAIDTKALTDALAAAKPGAGLSAEDVKKLLADDRSAQATAAKDRTERETAHKARFKKALDETKGLSEDTRKRLHDAVEGLITADLTEAQVDQLAVSQIKLGNDMEADAKRLALGLPGPAGSPRIDLVPSNEVMSLQQEINKALRQTGIAERGGLLLAEKDSPFVARVLAAFDAVHGPRLMAEAKRLAGGPVNIADTSLPASFTRTVIREALSDLRVLELVQGIVDTTSSATINVPYETRDTSAVVNDGVVYEGQGIPNAGVSQAMDIAYTVPMKLGVLISNEVMHFSRSNQHIDWDAWGRNIESNARVMRELVVRRICNHMQREADAYLAANIADENLDAQLGGDSIVKTAQFPIVRPYQKRDLAGNAIGNEENPITVKLNGVAIGRYDGTNTQGAGTYYRVVNYNLGVVQFVSELGAPVAPAATANADTISYSYATNVVKFDIDVPGGTTLDKHLNGLLRAIGARKAMMLDDRFIEPDFLLMSHTLNNQCSDAEQFSPLAERKGTTATPKGDLEGVRGIPAWASNAPGVDLGDERILMGQRGTLTYGVSKPWQMSDVFEAVNNAGVPIGKKRAYGEEYNAIHVPAVLRNRFTSVIVYGVTARNAL